MKSTSIATMALRLAAIYFWLQALLGCTFLVRIWMADDPMSRPVLGGQGLAMAATVVLGGLLWAVSARWADRILGARDGSTTRALEMGTLGFRLIGIWLFDRALQTSATFLDAFARTSPPSRFSVVPEIATFVLQIVFAALLLLGARNLAKRCFPSPVDASPTPSAYQPLAFSVLAVVILMDAIPDLVRSLLHSGFWTSDVWNSPDYKNHIVVDFVRVALGLLLFVGTRPLARFWRWIRTAGLDRESVSGA